MITTILAAALLVAPADAEACAGIEPRIQAAAQALADRKLDEAEKILAPLESSHFLCWKVLLNLGRLRLEQGNYPRASTLSELALAWAQDNADALLFRGQMLALQNQITQAQELLTRACKLAPDNAEAHFQLGVLFDRNKRNPQAVEEFEKTVALRPADARAYDYLALNLEPMGEFERAEAAYRKGLAVNQGPFADLFLDYNYGRLLMKLNRLAESKKHLDRALELAPGVRAVNYEHARLNMRLENLKGARSDAERAVSISDSTGYVLDLQVYNLLIQIYTRLGEEELVRKYVELSRSAKVPIQSRERK